MNPEDDDILQALLAGGITPDQVEAQAPMLEPEPWVPAGELTGLDAQFAAPAPMAPPTEARQIPIDQLESLVPTPSMAPNEAASYVMGKEPGTHAFGVRDTRSNPQSEVERLRQMYAQMADEQPQKQQEGPGPYEREFLAMHGQGMDKNMRMAALFRALAGGDPMDIWKMAQGRQEDYYKGLMQAREMDKRRGQRIDQALAELLVLSGISPEAAIQVTYDSPLLDIFKAGGMHLGSRIRGQDTQILRTDIGETGETYRQRIGEIGKNERAMLSADTQLKSARIRKRGGGGGGGAPNDALLSAYLQRQENVSPEIADAFVAGTLDPSSVSPETFARLQTAETLFRGLEPKKQAELTKGILAREGGEVDRPEVAAAVKQADPKLRAELKKQIAGVGQPLFEALKGWKNLSPKARRAFVGIGIGGTGSMEQFARHAARLQLTPQEQAAATSLYGLINDYVHRLSGAATSGGEWPRMASRLGITGTGVSPFQSTSAFEAFLRQSRDEYLITRNNILSEFPDLYKRGE